MSEHGRIPATARARGKIAPAKFAHVVMRTKRYKAMIDWYQTVLEAEVMYANNFITFLTYDDEHHRVAIANMPGLLPKPKFLSGVDHVAYTYPNLGDLLQTYRRLERTGIKPHWCINHGGTTSMYYHDPDRNQVELQIDNFHSHDEINAFLGGPAFTENAIGIDFDPDELLARLEAGESEQELVRWKEIRPRGPETIPISYTGRLHGTLLRLAARVGVRK